MRPVRACAHSAAQILTKAPATASSKRKNPRSRHSQPCSMTTERSELKRGDEVPNAFTETKTFTPAYGATPSTELEARGAQCIGLPALPCPAAASPRLPELWFLQRANGPRGQEEAGRVTNWRSGVQAFRRSGPTRTVPS